MINRLELNNKAWLRKACRWLNIKLVPNFEVEELYVILGPEVYVIIGESSDGSYEAYIQGTTDVRYLDRWTVDDDSKLVKVVYKNLKTCTISCAKREDVINGLTTEYVEFTVTGTEETDRALDMFEREVEEYLDYGDVQIDGTNGVFTVECKYLVKDRKTFNIIRKKYDGKFGN